MTKQTFFGDSHPWQNHRSLHIPLFPLLLILSVLFAQGSDAQEPGTVQHHLLAASRLYESLEYERALQHLLQAKRYSGGPQDDVLISLYEGAVLADLGRSDASDVAFKAALLLHPEATLPVQVSPKVEQRFESLREQVKRELSQAPDLQHAPAQVPATETHPTQSSSEPPAAVADVVSAPQGLPPSPRGRTPDSPGTQVSSGRGMSARVWLPGAIGGALLVGGGASYLLASGEQSKLRGNGEGLATFDDVKRATSRGTTYQWVGLGLAGAGVVGLGLSAGMYLLGDSSSAQHLAVDVSTDGTSAFVSGRWP
ncbi:hypothetical protein HRD49_02325 [Corallococcus exiguus]|uniref:hypothetical protein n=1 Tax=Corallococcus exiguus TaxID=83462 RepID=UPI001560BE93|nr:hypothetical protein [Corallococcus exiguus]NRD60575.1 hypothetical protein [Corallococcus exiguus]